MHAVNTLSKRGAGHMARTAAQGKPVRIESRWFQQGYAHGVSATRASRVPGDPREETIVGIIEHILSIVEDDGQISPEQMKYEAGILVGYLVTAIG
jgi:hypothetical protein